MGQKVSPTGFRLGITEDWRSRWYADKDYAANLANDLAIREFIDKELARAAVSRVEIERAGDKTKVIITTARPGVVIGKKGAEIDALRKKLQKIATGTVSVEVMNLPIRLKEVVLLYYFEDMNTTEIAETLRISQQAVSGRLLRARAKLRKALGSA